MVWSLENTVKPLNRGHVGVLKILSVIERCPLLEGNLRRLSHYRLNVLTAIHGISAILDVRYCETSLYVFFHLFIAEGISHVIWAKWLHSFFIRTISLEQKLWF